MFDLAYPFDDEVEIDGTTYTIDMSFDNVLRLIDLLSDKEIDDITQIETGLEMLLDVELDYDIQTKEEIFFNIFQETIGKDAEKEQTVDIEGNPMPEDEEEQIYSIKQDAEYIYASFYQDYGIDLFEMQGKLHWLKFKALLGGLRADTKFKEILDIRTMELPTGKGTEKQRNQIKKAKELYRLKEE